LTVVVAVARRWPSASARGRIDLQTSHPELTIMPLIVLIALAVAIVIAAIAASTAEPGGLSGPTPEHWATR
jgi:hypothetical protein